MVCVSAYYYNHGKYLMTKWVNFKATHRQFDVSIKSYEGRTLKKRWQWQQIDPDGIDRGRSFHRRLSVIEDLTRLDYLYIFSPTGKVRYVSKRDLRKHRNGTAKIDIRKRPHGKYRYHMPMLTYGHLRNVIATPRRNIVYGAYLHDDGGGAITKFNIKNGKVLQYNNEYRDLNALGGLAKAKYLVGRSGSGGVNWLHIWNANSKYLVFDSYITGAVAFHPKKKEVAMLDGEYVRFAIERPKRVIRLSKNWQKLNLFVKPQTMALAYTKDESSFIFGMHGRGATPRKEGAGSHLSNMRYNRHWARWLSEAGNDGTQLLLRGFTKTRLEIWGGLSKREYNMSTAQMRKRLGKW